MTREAGRPAGNAVPVLSTLPQETPRTWLYVGHPVDKKAPVKHAAAIRFDEYSKGGGQGTMLHRWKLHAYKRGKKLPAAVPAGWGPKQSGVNAGPKMAVYPKPRILSENASTPSSELTTHYTVELYDVLADPGERLDVSSEHPDIVMRMLYMLEAAQVGEAPQVTPDPRCSKASLLHDAGLDIDVLAPWCDTRQ